MKEDCVVVPRKDYEELLHTVQDMRTKYTALLDDKQRWRNFALLSAATNLVAENKCFSDESAIKRAKGLLALIEGGDNVEPGTGK
jgi:hypothetical protein